MSYTEQGKNGNGMNWILGGALILIGIFVTVSLVLIKSQADTSPQNISSSTTITNEAPVIDNVYITNAAATYSSAYDTGSNPISLNDSGTNSGITNVYVAYTYNDPNGWDDFAPGTGSSNITVDAFTYKVGSETAANSGSCSADGNNCYHITSSSCTGPFQNGDATHGKGYCVVNLEWYADGTDGNGLEDSTAYWKFKTTITDISGLSHNLSSSADLATSRTVDLSTLTQTFSETAVGGTVQSTAPVIVTLTGNDTTNLVYKAGSFTCTPYGSIDYTQRKYAETSAPESWVTGGTAFTSVGGDSVGSISGYSGRATADGTGTATTIYQALTVPTGAAGTCEASDELDINS